MDNGCRVSESVYQNEASKQVVSSASLIGGMRHSGNQLLLASTSSHDLPGRGSEKAFNECLGASNVFPSAA